MAEGHKICEGGGGGGTGGRPRQSALRAAWERVGVGVLAMHTHGQGYVSGAWAMGMGTQWSCQTTQ